MINSEYLYKVWRIRLKAIGFPLTLILCFSCCKQEIKKINNASYWSLVSTTEPSTAYNVLRISQDSIEILNEAYSVKCLLEDGLNGSRNYMYMDRLYNINQKQEILEININSEKYIYRKIKRFSDNFSYNNNFYIDKVNFELNVQQNKSSINFDSLNKYLMNRLLLDSVGYYEYLNPTSFDEEIEIEQPR